MAFPGSDELIQAAEALLRRRLPDALRNRLITNNGGEIWVDGEDWRLFPVWDPKDRKTMGRTANHVVRENEALRQDWPDILPEGHIAIADNGGGDLLVLAPDDDDILFWDHETRDLSPVAVDWSEA